MDSEKSMEITPAMIEAGADRMFDVAPDCLNYQHGAIEVYKAMREVLLSEFYNRKS